MTSLQPNPPLAPGAVLKPHRGALVLTLGILGLVVCVICGIIAWVLANADLRDMDAGRMDPAGRQLTQAGKICGIVSACLMAVGVLGMCVWLAFVTLIIGGAAAAGSSGGRRPPLVLPYIAPLHP